MDDELERRGHTRLPVARGELRHTTRRFLATPREPDITRLVDVSLGGVRFTARAPVTPGLAISLELLVPAYRAPIALRVEVVWSATLEGGEHHAGAKFLGLDDDARAALERLIDDGKRRSLMRVRLRAIEGA